jgi:hypothetical protein
MIVVIRESILFVEKMVILLILKLKSVFIWKAKGKAIKLSVISSLALQFSFLLFIICGRNFANTTKFDQAIFRLSGQVYFLSDLKDNQSALKKLSCISGPTYISKFIGQNLDGLSKLTLEDKKKQSVVVSRSQLNPFIYLEKLKNTALSRTREKLSKNELARLDKSCSKIVWKNLSISEKAVLLTEVYLRDRYSSSDNLNAAFVELRKALDVKDSHEIFTLNASSRMKTQVLKQTTDSVEKADKAGEEEESAQSVLGPNEP